MTCGLLALRPDLEEFFLVFILSFLDSFLAVSISKPLNWALTKSMLESEDCSFRNFMQTYLPNGMLHWFPKTNFSIASRQSSILESKMKRGMSSISSVSSGSPFQEVMGIAFPGYNM
jgi:hypothetical protein